MKRFLSSLDYRCYAVLAGLGVYAVFGSPTPEHFGAPEIAVGALLMIAIGAAGIMSAISVRKDAPLWQSAGRVLLAYGLICGSVGGLLAGQDVRVMLRDLIAFGFLCLPLFFYPFLIGRAGAAQSFLIGALFVGAAFSVRAVILEDEALYYLGNSPCVLFAVLLGIGVGLERLSRGFNARNIAVAGCGFALARLCVLPLIEAVQRASLAMVALYCVFALAVVMRRAPRRGIVLVMVLLPLVWWFAGDLAAQAYAQVFEKSHLVGANMRAEEWRAVWAEISARPLSALFGNGWGAGFSSPAVADIRVNFTHSLLSSMLLKTGIIGMGICVFYLAALARVMVGGLRAQPLFIAALAAPIVIDVFLYGAYKSLDFGVILAFCLYPLIERHGFLKRF